MSTASEWTFIASSLRTPIRELTDAQVKRGVERARTLRDKYRDLGRRQHRQVQPRRSGRTGEDLHVRTKRKVVLFSEVLERFRTEQRRRAATVRKSRPARSTAARTPSPTITRRKRAAAVPKLPVPPTPAPPKVKESVATAVPRAAIIAARTGQHRKHAHASSATRRHQGRRDRR